MPIVGGSGVFRLAQGIATAKTYWFNLTSGDDVVEYNVMVLCCEPSCISKGLWTRIGGDYFSWDYWAE